jgi:hypothetical protein
MHPPWGVVEGSGSSSPREVSDEESGEVAIGVSPRMDEQAETSTTIGTKESAVDRLKSGRDGN